MFAPLQDFAENGLIDLWDHVSVQSLYMAGSLWTDVGDGDLLVSKRLLAHVLDHVLDENRTLRNIAG